MGCGHGNILRDIALFGRKQGFTFQLIGIDANQEAISYANELSSEFPEITLKTMDIFSPEFQKLEYHVVLCTLFAHHLKDDKLTHLLKNLLLKAKIGIVVNDLHRHKLAYYLFKLIGLFVKNKMVCKDGLTSILRAFKRKDLEKYQKKFTQKRPFSGNGRFVINGFYKNHECKNSISCQATTKIYPTHKRDYSLG